MQQATQHPAPSPLRWFILALCTLTAMIVYAIPALTIPVLFAEIAADLNLDIIELGFVWGSVSITSMIISLLGGTLGDRFGSKLSLGVACLLTGLFGMLRGLAPSFGLLIASFLLYGLVAPSIAPLVHKTAGYFFPKQRGLAAGTISFGFALALFVGFRFTATWISPTVGGWRNVMFVFGVIGVVFAAIWLLLIPAHLLPPIHKQQESLIASLLTSLRYITKLHDLWIIGIATAFFWACYRGLTGYTPTYLRNLGWSAESADSTLATFFLCSLILAIPLSLLSDRLPSRRNILIIALLAMGLGVGLLGLGNQALILPGLIIAGIIFDAYMSIHQATVLDLPGVGAAYAGTALGFTGMMREVGGIFGPPLGNYLAQFNPNAPFLLWGGLALLGALIYLRLSSS